MNKGKHSTRDHVAVCGIEPDFIQSVTTELDSLSSHRDIKIRL